MLIVEVNDHNSITSINTNSHEFHEIHIHRPEKLNIWTGMITGNQRIIFS